MPGYIKKAFLVFHQYICDNKPCHTPHPYTPPSYGKKVQLAKQESTEPKLPKKEITTVWQVVGRLLYYVKAIDNNLLISLNTVAVQQDKATKYTIEF